MWVIMLVLCVAAAVFSAVIFNLLIKRRMLMREALAGIDVQLKRRHDLIPNIVEVVKGYAKFESATLQGIVQLRTQAAGAGTLAQKSAFENELTQSLRQVFALVEAYPDLKASRQF
ncbi:MAG: LemA family protein, partial [Eubacteriales bacterium]|nr:LemA family protein [Eubacteriales bacterium]